ncbi:membrane protein [Streptomyces longispororuber]|uniref:Membrane protein n=1 Tax=Streptomyces longispororuber TaxID=68230 RepID=A0A919DX45_9ACTN|nr:LytR C-terminal domain-containing protein [Streptomyces longispororuber]GHE87537.1 membrane protein [Streptomyces longispororuber]
MSMLTPPGMGGKYRITGDKYPRMRRPSGRRRIVLAAVAALAAVGLIGWGTLQLIDVFTGGEASAAGAAKGAAKAGDCAGRPGRTAAPPLPEPRRITVNVLNATPRGGLAKETADELKKRGFTIGKVANAPKAYDKKVKSPGMVLGPKSAADTALPVLAAQLAGAEQRTDAREGATVDLIIGDRFKALAGQRDAARALAALATSRTASSKPSSADGKHC